MVKDKVKILVVGAEPDDASGKGLRIDRFISKINKGIATAEKTEEFKVDYLMASNFKSFRQGLAKFKPDVLHLIGHGDTSNRFAFEDEMERELVRAKKIAKVIQLYPNIKEVIISACHSESLSKLLIQQKKIVVGYGFGLDGNLIIDTAYAYIENFYFYYSLNKELVGSHNETITTLEIENYDLKQLPKLFTGNSELNKTGLKVHELLPKYKLDEYVVIEALKQIPIQYDEDRLDRYDSELKTILIHSPSPNNYKKGLNWFWNMKILDDAEISFVKNGNTSISGIEQVLGGVLGMEEFDIRNEDDEIDEAKRTNFVNQLIARLKTQDIYLVIDNAFELIKKTDDINFLVDLWKPISQQIEAAIKEQNIEYSLILLLVQNRGKLRVDKYQFCELPQESISDKLPLLIEYNGFFHRDKKHHQTDKDSLKNWLQVNYKILNHQYKPLTNKSKKHKQLFLQKLNKSCECGNIEKLFEAICNEFGYTIEANNLNKGKIKWRIKPKSQIEEDTLEIV